MDRSLPVSLKSFRSEMKKSRFKIWLRAALFIQFSVLFCFYFLRDISNGYFVWRWVAILFMLFVPLGFLMSRIVPMKFDPEANAVTLSIDRIYLLLIWVLVIAKLIASRIPGLITVSDVIMCVILGVMFGRLSGIGIRVRRLKIQHRLIKN